MDEFFEWTPSSNLTLIYFLFVYDATTIRRTVVTFWAFHRSAIIFWTKIAWLTSLTVSPLHGFVSNTHRLIRTIHSINLTFWTKVSNFTTIVWWIRFTYEVRLVTEVTSSTIVSHNSRTAVLTSWTHLTIIESCIIECTTWTKWLAFSTDLTD